MDVHHTAIRVSDLEATRAFYEGGLGRSFDREFEDGGIRNYYVSGDTGAGIQFRHGLEGAVAVEPAGIEHLAIRVDDVEATFEGLLEETDCPVVEEPEPPGGGGPRTAIVSDPDGYVVDLLEFPD